LRLEDVPTKPGIYVLIIRKTVRERITVGRVGSYVFPKGYYSYTGSALGTHSPNLRNRITYHMSPKKRGHWHIDFLLGSKGTMARGVVLSEANGFGECDISRGIEDLQETTVCAKGFGSTDCKSGCQTHLHYFQECGCKEVVKDVSEVFRKRGLKPKYLLLN